MTEKRQRRPWTAEEFRSFAVALVGSAHGWQAAVARMLGVSDRTVRRWASGATPLPDRVRDELLRLAGVEDDAGLAYPRDEWILGVGEQLEPGARREYIVHARPPRFVARIVMIDPLTDRPDPDEDPVDETGIVYRVSSAAQICEFQWIDRPPSGGDLVALLEAAADVIERA